MFALARPIFWFPRIYFMAVDYTANFAFSCKACVPLS